MTLSAAVIDSERAADASWIVIFIKEIFSNAGSSENLPHTHAQSVPMSCCGLSSSGSPVAFAS